MSLLKENGKRISLSDVDKKILKAMLIPNGIISPKGLASRLGLPPSTVQRRIKRLRSVLRLDYSLELYKFGWRRIDFLIATENGMTTDIAHRLFEQDDITYVEKTIGQHTIDLKAEIIVKDNAELLVALEKVRALNGVREVMWSETVESLGKKVSVPSHVIDKL